jgi:hypothetical protein
MNQHFRSEISKKSNRFRARSLGAAAITVGATAAAGESTAAIIYDLSGSYSSGDVFSLDGTAFGEIELILNGMAGLLNLSLAAPQVMMGDSSTLEYAFFSTGEMMATEYLDPLTAMDTVDGSLGFSSQAFLKENGVDNPSWAPGSTAYAGFVFDPTGTQPLYGWLSVTFDPGGGDLWLDQWAYDDTGGPIAVGFIPEPTTALMLGLGLMGLVVAARRNGRSSAATDSD